MSVFLTITGPNGQINGPCLQPQRENTIEAELANLGVQMAGGRPTAHQTVDDGKRSYSPLVFTKDTDSSSPALFQVLKNGSEISLVADTWGRNERGQLVKVISIEMKRARIVDIAVHEGPQGLREHFSVTFDDIRLAHNIESTSFEDANIWSYA